MRFFSPSCCGFVHKGGGSEQGILLIIGSPRLFLHRLGLVRCLIWSWFGAFCIFFSLHECCEVVHKGGGRGYCSSLASHITTVFTQTWLVWFGAVALSSSFLFLLSHVLFLLSFFFLFHFLYLISFFPTSNYLFLISYFLILFSDFFFSHFLFLISYLTF